MTPEKKEAKPDEPKDEAPEEPRKKRTLLPKEKLYAIRKLQLADANVISPWYDMVGNDTDAMVINLYAKGLTTRDISSYLKKSKVAPKTQNPDIKSRLSR